MHPRRQDDRGQTVLALAIIVILGLCLVMVRVMLPIGRAADLRERAQAAADAAALAGATEIRQQVLDRWSLPLAGVAAVDGWVNCGTGAAPAANLAGRNDARVTQYCYASFGDRVQVRVQGLTSIDGQLPQARAQAKMGIDWGSCQWQPDPLIPLVRPHFVCGSLDVPFLLDILTGRLTLDTPPGWLDGRLVPTLVA